MSLNLSTTRRDLALIAGAVVAIAANLTASHLLTGAALGYVHTASAVAGALALFVAQPPQHSAPAANSATPVRSSPQPSSVGTGPLSPSKGSNPVTFSVSLSGHHDDPAADAALFDELEKLVADPANGITSAGGVKSDGSQWPAPPPVPAPTPAEELAAALEAGDLEAARAAFAQLEPPAPASAAPADAAPVAL